MTTEQITDPKIETYIRLFYDIPENHRTIALHQKADGDYVLEVEGTDGMKTGHGVSREMAEQPVIPDYPESTWQRFHDAGWAPRHSDAYERG